MGPQNPDGLDRMEIGRRDFLKRAAALGAGLTAALTGKSLLAAAASSATAAKDDQKETRNVQPGIEYRRLGRTRFDVSALTFGCIQLDTDNLGVLDAAVDRGINLVHTNQGYTGGKSIRALGQWFKTPGNRRRVFLALKPNPSGGRIQPIDDDLRTLNTDHVDLLMVPLDNPESVAHPGILESFAAMKRAGKARRLGLTFHSNLGPIMQAGLKANFYDVFLPTYNMPAREALKPLIPEAKQKDIGLLTMKSTQGLRGDEDPVPVWRTLLEDGIDAVLRTMTSRRQLDQFIRLAQKGERTAAQVSAADCTGLCTLCGACRECPGAVAIQDTLRTYQYYAEHRGWTDEARAQYAAIPPAARAMACRDCGRCESVCPQRLNVRRLVREAHAYLA